jgi:CDP-diacylglycerol--serine O-phosphatidyltransferase
MKNIPNLFTLLNLFFGCIAVILIMQNGIAVMYTAEGEQFVGLPERICIASFFIGLAALVDFLDGMVARLFKAVSPLGKQLDSLADMVSFGVAPGLILYQLLRTSYSSQENGLDVPMIWFLPALIIPCAAAYRLAKFNVDDSQQYGFKGVPTPAAGVLIASLPLIYFYSNSNRVTAAILNKLVLYGLVALLSWLMISNLPIMSLKFRDYSKRSVMPKLVILALAVASAFLLKWLAVPVIFVFYVLISLILAGKKYSQDQGRRF